MKTHQRGEAEPQPNPPQGGLLLRILGLIALFQVHTSDAVETDPNLKTEFDTLLGHPDLDRNERRGLDLVLRNARAQHPSTAKATLDEHEPIGRLGVPTGAADPTKQAVATGTVVSPVAPILPVPKVEAETPAPEPVVDEPAPPLGEPLTPVVEPELEPVPPAPTAPAQPS